MDRAHGRLLLDAREEICAEVGEPAAIVAAACYRGVAADASQCPGGRPWGAIGLSSVVKG
ncbi:hypothetical protein [Lysobacter gummosus]|uniref:hypothetical protein n=1 Tax=Lysobacter gummosus TaxID=262324 RepID=UPI003625D02A